ncbi:uncharacterized protein SPPG_02547 [Spizellomyces punctatus DAOM BR117]|uniref:Uncharacterized protein n=1 Tax=Spizellomyces punctatus (strain DAOM BR117) TaxID=645134 RepID=A0A0L0HLU7_SPIPD|nr:uncharacterized protein SPPG_02547 [Spizellomyces punctatus DAOM BR117]KND02043.1 hypothetical protein SPPG_02547 [Spizellomyces punctatus DAOM BR117]|eukprot:XP_016610082.1 hypothetical protein SPPG_02547 [Spizellomyces punctatus DAOM BR117]
MEVPHLEWSRSLWPGLKLTAEESELLEEIWLLDLPFLVDNPSGLAYAVVVDPMSFLPAYCRLSSLYEKHGFRRFSAIPLRRSLIQSHIRIDTVILYQHILGITRQEQGVQVSQQDPAILWVSCGRQHLQIPLDYLVSGKAGWSW